MKNYHAMHQRHVDQCQQGKQGGKPNARSATAEPVAGDAGENREYAIMRKLIENDNNHLKAHYPDHAERNEHKPAILDKYRQYLEGWLADETQDQVQNDVLVRCAIWAADCLQFDWSIQLADAGKTMETGFQRDLPTFVADAVLQANKQLEAKEAVLERIENGNWEVNHPLMAKYYKYFAVHYKTENPRLALSYAENSLETYSKSAVKTLINDLKTAVSKL